MLEFPSFGLMVSSPVGTTGYNEKETYCRDACQSSEVHDSPYLIVRGVQGGRLPTRDRQSRLFHTLLCPQLVVSSRIICDSPRWTPGRNQPYLSVRVNPALFRALAVADGVRAAKGLVSDVAALLDQRRVAVFA